MSARHSTKWFWCDWAGDPAVRRLTPAERGMWIDLLSIASDGEPVGFVCDVRGDPVAVEEIARFANCSAAEALSLIDGILKKGAASRDRSGRLFNRRMVRDYATSVKRRAAGEPGGAATKLRWQAFQSLPHDLPGHVPRQTGSAPFQEELINTSFGTARARETVENSGSNDAALPAGFAEKARQAVQQNPGKSYLVEALTKHGRKVR
jgi:hypothetical protein